MHSIRSKAIFATFFLVEYAAAITSLYIPGFDPQPVTANVLGVGADGATTYLIAPGVSSGTFDDSGFDGPATLVVGASSVGLTYIDPNVGNLFENCGIADGLAVCTDVIEQVGPMSFTSTVVVTETVSSFPVQGGAPTAVTTTSTGVSTGATADATTTSSGGSNASSGPSSSASTTTTASQNKNSGGVKTTFIPFFLILSGSVVALLMIL
ncbi:uncharacterized protein FIBRA_01644 [Fibroporia radiculosa]|uniref:Uncharacterized protein n=1 Tax=Fibroporia radiculosa TaxID=599839 RepID=J4GKW0_9APHY|nr:uncharacterized protein FIBRA_01644 [Fibroporia radiculosa]CCL99625.1 predicted protein [Fibroporia radiculosa]